MAAPSSSVVNKKALLRNKGRMWVLDELAATKAFKEVTVVDSVEVKHPVNTTEIKTPSGITIFKTQEPGAMLSLDIYHPGDLTMIERLFRGIVEKTAFSGGTATENVAVSFRNLGDCAVLPGFNGAKTAVTVNSVKSADLATTYTGSGTDYAAASADSLTGMTILTHISGGAIPLNTDVIVNYTYTPLTSTVVKPNYDGNIIDRFIVIDSFTDKSDNTKYRRYFLPRATVTSDLVHRLLEVGKENTAPNLLHVDFELSTPDVTQYDPTWYWIDTYNV